MKKLFYGRIGSTVLLCCLLAILFQPMNVYADTWHLDSVGWWWQRDNGSYPAACWEKIGGEWYYFNEDGYMKTGWLSYKDNWYYLDQDGVMQTGWLLNGSKWYYFNSDGVMQTGWILDGGKWYYLNYDGTMQTGWLADDGIWYYLDPVSGVMAVERWEGDYYLTASGAMATNQWIANTYYVDETGKWNSNAHLIDLGGGSYYTVIGSYNTAFEDEVIRLLNEYRVANGLNPLLKEDNLSKQADIRAYEIVYKFSHSRPNGTMCFSLVDDAGYSSAGENIAAGQSTPLEVFTAWKNSPGHNANMLDPDFTLIGVGCFYTEGSRYGYHWVQFFGSY